LRSGLDADLVGLGGRESWTTIEHDRDLFREFLEPALRQRGDTIIWSEELPTAALTLKRSHQSGVTAVVFDEGKIAPFDPNPLRYAHRAKTSIITLVAGDTRRPLPRHDRGWAEAATLPRAGG